MILKFFSCMSEREPGTENKKFNSANTMIMYLCIPFCGILFYFEDRHFEKERKNEPNRSKGRNLCSIAPWATFDCGIMLLFPLKNDITDVPI